MPRGCKICKNKQVKDIDKAIISGETLQKIADRFDLHPSTISRHKNHIADKITKASIICDAQEGANVLQKVSGLLKKAHDLLDTAEQSGDIRTAIQAVRETRGCLELLARVSGEMAPEKLEIMIEPVVNTVVQVLRAEIHDPKTLQRIHDRLLTIDAKGGLIDV